MKLDFNEEGVMGVTEDEITLKESEARDYIHERVVKTAEDLLSGGDYLKVIREKLAEELRGNSKIKEQEFEKSLMRYDIKVDELERRLNNKENVLTRLEANISTQADRLEQYEGIIKEKEKELNDLGESFNKAFKYTKDLDELTKSVQAITTLLTSKWAKKNEEIELLED